eukprot:SAG11_NODE_182_length_13233_cov_59.525238_8_plen_102_part_00
MATRSSTCGMSLLFHAAASRALHCTLHLGRLDQSFDRSSTNLPRRCCVNRVPDEVIDKVDETDIVAKKAESGGGGRGRGRGRGRGKGGKGRGKGGRGGKGK